MLLRVDLKSDSRIIHIRAIMEQECAATEDLQGRGHSLKGLKTGVVIHGCIKWKKLFEGTGKTITGVKYNLVLVDRNRSNIYCLA